jgi:hypothetical protein
MTPARGAGALQRHNEAVLLARAGRPAEACELFARIIAGEGPDHCDLRTLKATWQIGRAAGRWPLALGAGLRAAVRDPLDFPFAQRLLESLRECPDDVLAAKSVTLPSVPLSLSIVIVSRDDARFAGAASAFAQAFAGWPHDLVRVRDAASMYDGYARGFAATRGDIVAFAHDDIRFAIPDFAARLADAMATADMVGVAGTTKVSGPAVFWSGQPWMRGAITHRAPADAAYEFALPSFAGPRTTDAQGLDGVFLAMRRPLAARIGFDPATFAGFHLYDLDLSYRAYLAGARVAIAADLALIHASRGAFDDKYTVASNAFVAKFPELSEAPGAHRHWYALALPDEAAVTGTYRKLLAAWELALP